MTNTSLNNVRHRTVTANGIRIHLAEAGDPDSSKALALMVHGFPESWYSWRYQLPALAEAGYHAVAIDVRGYGRSSKPSRVKDYRMVQKVADVVGVIEALGNRPTVLIGHDWGAPIVWNTALLRGCRWPTPNDRDAHGRDRSRILHHLLSASRPRRARDRARRAQLVARILLVRIRRHRQWPQHCAGKERHPDAGHF